MSIQLMTVIALGCTTPDDDEFEVDDADREADNAFDEATADGKADSALSYLAVAQLARNAGLACSGDRIALAVAVAKAESNFRANATNTAGNSHGVDRGLWQINSYYHPNVSDACAFSPNCNARAMASISRFGTTWRPWWTYVNGKHLPFMASARSAQATLCAE